MYLIDGHNLIPNLPGLNLAVLEDEDILIQWLQVFCRQTRKRAEVYFDGAPPGRAGVRRVGGSLTAHFVRQGSTADDAIARRLRQLGRDARNWKVVSSDRRVQAEAASAGAERIRSDEFARQLQRTLAEAPDSGAPAAGGDIEEWLRLFGAEDENS